MIQPKYHVFICTSSKINGQQKGFCHTKSSVDLVQRMIEEVEDRGLSSDVTISNTGCFGICEKGPVVVVYPEGIWYGSVTEDDIERIVEEHFEGGTPVKDLQI